jgi:ParB family chromosome partitioning protein
MAIIATLKAAEHDVPANIHSIASIPLNKLLAWNGNVRKTGVEERLEELTASIAAHGVLQSLVVRKANRGKFAIIAGRRRYLALSSLAKGGTIPPDAPVPCRIVPGSADATEISLTENVVRAPMHPADQYEAFRELIDSGSTIADIAARFGISEVAVRQRLKLARVSPALLEAYRGGELSLEQIQAFAISDDHEAQERLLGEMSRWNSDPKDIRAALTQDEIPATDNRARFVSPEVYEMAGGAIRRDLFAQGTDGIFLLNPDILDRLALAKLEAEADKIRQEGWKWVEARPQFDYADRGEFLARRPEPLPVSEEARAEEQRLAEEYQSLFESSDEHDEATQDRLDAIEARIAEIEGTERAFTPETMAVAGAIVSIGHDGDVEVTRGLIRREEAAALEDGETASARNERPAFPASLVESLTEHRSAAIGAVLCGRPEIALAALVHSLAARTFSSLLEQSALQISNRETHLKNDSTGRCEMRVQMAKWSEALPGDADALWDWCLAQTPDTLLSLLAFCVACSVDGVQRKADRADCDRLLHAQKLSQALGLQMTAWFTPTAANYFSRVSRADILAALKEAKNLPAKRSWEKLKKSELAALAEREIAGTDWLPQPLR